jgi:hypothetical protein
MLNADQFLEQERRRLDEEAEALARVKEKVIPAKRYVEPPAVPDATAADLRKWQAATLGAFITLNGWVVKKSWRADVDWRAVLIVNLALFAALIYTRYRMYRLRRTQER